MGVVAVVVGVVLGAASSAAGAAPDPARLVLRQGDVPSSYHLNRTKSGHRSVAQDAREFPELRKKYVSWGHIAAYQVQFDHVNDRISSRVDLLRTRAGARAMLAWFVRETNRQSQQQLRPARFRIGDAGMLYAWKFGDEGFTIVLWRKGGVFSIVGGDGISKASVIALARRQERRIEAVLR